MLNPAAQAERRSALNVLNTRGLGQSSAAMGATGRINNALNANIMQQYNTSRENAANRALGYL
ncbi:MAG: hypothetical protein FWE51_04505 [Coriobacteriia bacterium]|nr:hypothetical protein [Coriobacteriia bacterium]